MNSLFLDHENMCLALDLYELTMAAAYYDNAETHDATFELFVRKFPRNRSYLIAAGLEQAVDYLQNLRFTKPSIKFLKRHPYFSTVSQAFFDYLKKFRFSGDLWSMPEGTVVFTNEPILRVTAPIIEAQLIETFILSTVNFQTLISTKASRVVQAAKGRQIIEFGARRAHGPQAAVLAARAAYIGGCVGTSNVLAGYLLGIPIYGTIAHSYVLNFETEREAFEKYCKVFPRNTTLLVDTYDTMQGVRNAISVGIVPAGVRLDSGDLLELSRKVRRLLDEAGYKDTRILASGDLNEYLISDLMSKDAPIDSFGVGTELSTSRDDPALPGIYKLVSLRKDNKIIYKMKLSEGKKTIPGAKQIYRFYEETGQLKEDVIALDDEPQPTGGQPMITEVMRKGKLVTRLPELRTIQEYSTDQVNRLPQEYKDLERVEEPPIKLSAKLREISS